MRFKVHALFILVGICYENYTTSYFFTTVNFDDAPYIQQIQDTSGLTLTVHKLMKN